MSSKVAQNSVDTGLEVFDLREYPEFSKRSLHARDVAIQMEGMRRLTHAFVEDPSTILQELVNAAVQLCGADSAGISLEQENRTDANFYQWVATAGEYAHFLNATLPRHPSACSMTIERGQPQLFRVKQAFFDMMGIQAPLVTDGILLPWETSETRGTIWIMAHGRDEAFDKEDVQMMQVLADFAAMAVRHQHQQRILLQQTSNAASAAMANDLAHQINNPLQSLTNITYLAAEGFIEPDSRTLAQDLSSHLGRLSALVKTLLALPFTGTQPN